jgi:beta-glucanase (GH16 family)
MLPVEPGAPEYACVDDGTCFENTWPAWGDITIMAARSENPDQVMMGINYATDDGSGGLTHLGDFAEVPVTPTVAADYHVYAIEWGPQRIDWFLDDELVRSVDLTDARIYHPSGQNPFHRSFYLKLSLAVGGLTEPPVAADYPQEMRVRWVRVWQVE